MSGNNKNIIPVAEQVNSQVKKTVQVVPTRSIPEGFASLLAFDPKADAENNLAPMKKAAEQVMPGEITRAVRDSETTVGKVEEGDWIEILHGNCRLFRSTWCTKRLFRLNTLRLF